MGRAFFARRISYINRLASSCLDVKDLPVVGVHDPDGVKYQRGNNKTDNINE